MAELGFGIMRFRGLFDNMSDGIIQDAIKEYMRGNCRYFDLHPAYCDGKSQMIFRQYVSDKYDRSDYLVANKMPYYGIEAYSDYDKVFQKELTDCGVDYFDYYMLHCINDNNFSYHKKRGGFEYLNEIRSKNLARHVGISFHGSPELLTYILTKYEYIEFVQLQINFVDWESEAIRAKDCYEVAMSQNKDIIVMEPIKGGTLSKNIIVSGKNYSAADMADIALRYVANLNGVQIILSGMTNAEQVRANRESIKKNAVSEEILTGIIKVINGENIIACTKCGYCKKECVKNIDISKTIECLNEGVKNSGDGLTRRWFARLYYSTISEGNRASDCIGCGRCEEICPQQLYIRSYLQFAKELFENYEETVNKERFIRMQILFLNKSQAVRKQLDVRQRHKIYVYGAGKSFHDNYHLVKQFGRVIAVIDKDKTKQRELLFNEVECIDLSKAPTDAFIVIMIENESIISEIIKDLNEKGYKNCDILWNWIDYADQYHWLK